MRKLLAVLFILSCLISSSNQPIALACSGPSDSGIENKVEESTHVVVGYFVDVDDIGMNGIFRVESYLVGEPNAEFIAIRQIEQLSIRGFYEDYQACEGYQEVHKGDRAILFLTKDATGSYRTYDYPSFIFPNTNSRNFAFYYVEQDEEFVTNESASEEDIVAMVATVSQRTPQLPDFTLPNATTSPLLVTTSEGSAYLIPFDMGEPILLGKNVTGIENSGDFVTIFTADGLKIFNLYLDSEQHLEPVTLSEFLDKNIPLCYETECFQIAGNGMYSIIRNEGRIRICIQRGIGCEDEKGLDGNDFQVSPTGKLIAIWNNLELKIYSLDSVGGETALVDFSNEMNNPQLIWSPDGTQFAYSDNQGLWVWSGFAWEGKPRLVIPASEDIPYAIQFSSSGRYLLIHNGNEEYYLDLLSSIKLPNGILSPDERHIIYKNSETTYSVCNVSASILPLR